MNDLARFARLLAEELEKTWNPHQAITASRLGQCLKLTANRLQQSPEEPGPRLTSLLSALERISIAAIIAIDKGDTDKLAALCLIHDTANKALAEQTTSKP